MFAFFCCQIVWKSLKRISCSGLTFMFLLENISHGLIRIAAGSFLSFLMLAAPDSGQAVEDSLEDELQWLSAESIVFSAARREEKVFETQAAVYVITQEDIRRSGATSIPEVLRMAPGVHVARINSSKWQVTIRGMNGRFANKLLVLMDGRSVYTFNFGGVFWEVQDTVLEDIERIEIIRGPGATMWGANAVNGVINIITKNSSDTSGFSVLGQYGNYEKAASVRYGGKISDSLDYRIFAKQKKNDNFDIGSFDSDPMSQQRAGYRFDWEAGYQDSVMITGDIYKTKVSEYWWLAEPGPPFVGEDDSGSRQDGGNILFRWNRDVSDTSNFSLQMYYDHSFLDMAIFTEKRDTVDLDWQHHFQIGTQNMITWGGGYRYTKDHMDNSYTLSFEPESLGYELVNGFMQGESWLIQDVVRLTLGAKLEYHDFTGSEFQPNARLSWMATDRQMYWVSASRARRTPSRLEHDQNQKTYYGMGSLPGLNAPSDWVGHRFYLREGNENLNSENLNAYEIGARYHLTSTLELDGALFYYEYTDLVGNGLSSEVGWIEYPYAAYQGVYTENNMTADSHGVELSLNWKLKSWWELKGNYNYFKLRADDGEAYNYSDYFMEGMQPKHQFSLLSFMQFGDIETDLWLRYVDELAITYPDGNVATWVHSYFDLNLRLSWHMNEQIEMSLVAQNLLDNREYEASSSNAFRMPMMVYGKAVLSF